MRKKYFLLISVAAAMLSAISASAQNTYIPYGYLMLQTKFKITDMYDLSHFGTQHGTARSVAMGGAFTSLGADLSSMNINPAGLGMYRGSEFGTTVSLLTTRDGNRYPGEGVTKGMRTSLGLNNIGAAFNIYEGSGRLTSFTLGFGYNKLADYNYRSRLNVPHSNNTIVDMFDKILNVYAERPGNADRVDYDGAYYDEWASVMAYDTGLLERLDDGSFAVMGIGLNADAAPYLNVLSKGSAGEYTFSGGWNYSNKFYMGFSVGMIDYRNRRDVTFGEHYMGNDFPGDGVARNMNYNQIVETYGEGYNLKLGVIFRPVSELRIGLAIHSPSIVTLKTTYNSGMSVGYLDWDTQNAWSPEEVFTEKFYTPTRILAGLSYTFGDFGMAAVDYEYTAYNGMRVYGVDYDTYSSELSARDLYKEQVKNDFRGAHTVRFGGEMRPGDDLCLRVGASYVHEGLAQIFMDGENIFEAPVPKSSLTLSAGLGYRLSPTASFDLAYVYSHAKHTRYDLYSYDFIDNDDDLSNHSISGIELARTRHNLILSLNFRF